MYIIMFSFVILTSLATCFSVMLRLSSFRTTDCTHTHAPSQVCNIYMILKYVQNIFFLKKNLHLSLSPLLLSCNTLCLNCFMCSGILVTIVMKYADNIVKVRHGNMTLNRVRRQQKGIYVNLYNVWEVEPFLGIS